MSYSVKFQTEAAYKNIKYGSNSIYNSACGPASLCNALKALGIADISIPTMCSLAVSCGARVEGGTAMATLLKAASSKYGFTYQATSKNAELWEHLKNGGAAIMNNGSQYQLFSNSGHFVAAIGCTGSSTVIVADSYWYSGKYTANSIRRNYVTVVEKGVVKTSLIQCGKATIDRSPSYYLIFRKSVKVTDISKTVKTMTDLNVRSGAGTSYGVLGTLPKGTIANITGIADNGWYRIAYNGKNGYISEKYTQEVKDDMTEAKVRQIIAKVREEERQKAASAWAASAWNAAKDAGVVDGTAPQAPATREQVIQILSKVGLIGK